MECSKLGKTRIIEDANIRLVRNATFFEPNVHLYFHMKSPSAFLIILRIKAKSDMLIAAVPLCKRLSYKEICRVGDV